MTTTSHRSPAAHEIIDRIAGLDALDAPAQKVAKSVRDVTPAGPVKDALSGTWLGHALHPLLTDVPIGTWTSAVLLDWLGGSRSAAAAERLIGLGLLSAVPAWVTGMQEWADSEYGDDGCAGSERFTPYPTPAPPCCSAPRCCCASAARAGRASSSRWPAPARSGPAASSAGTWPSGRASASTRRPSTEGPENWTPVMLDADLPEGESRYAEVAGVGIMVARHQGSVYALSNRCAHRGGPLDEGELSDGCVTCPWHGSVFRLADGGVERGPSAYPQPAWQVRVQSGVIEIKPPATT
jgi:nitrite reductase/ring-hydroxylating ferredoxin subunit